MYCNLHSEYFSSGSSCESCREKLWTTDREVVKEIEKVKAEAAALKKEKEEFEELFKYQKNQAAKMERWYTTSRRKEEQTKDRIEELKRVKVLLENKLARYKASLDTLQWDHADSGNRIKLLKILLLRHTYLCNLGVSRENYKASQLREATEKEVGPDHSSRDVLIDQLRIAGLTKHDPLGWMDVERSKKLKMTGFVPGGMIEVHEVGCRIWPSSCAVDKKCTCGMDQKDSFRNL